MKYKKVIVLTLIFVMLFNIFATNVKASSWWENKVMRWAFIVFVSALNAYNVVVSFINAKALFENWWYGLSVYDRENFYNNTKTILNMGVIDVSIIGYGINEWIKYVLKEGYNSVRIKTGDDYNIVDGTESIINTVVSSAPSGTPDNTLYKTENYYFYIESKRVHVVLKLVKTYSNKVQVQLELYNMTGNMLGDTYKTTVEGNQVQIVVRKMNIMGTDRIQAGLLIADDEKWITAYWSSLGVDTAPPIPIEENVINYYAGEAVDYPMDEYPDDKPIVLPSPNFDDSRFRYDEAGNRVFDGTVDDFLDSAFDNQSDYIDIATDKILSGATSNAIVDANAGTITWPQAGGYVAPGITYPDVVVPDTVQEGVGETNSILQGIGEFVENIFAEPTKSIDFSPIMNFAITDRFPFCLPFDLYNIIDSLKASPEVPKFDVSFSIMNTPISHEINFEQFEKLAVITRWSIMLSYIVALILLSRKLIGGE